MALFDNGYPEEFLLFIGNFQMTLEASATIASAANIHYLCTLVRGEALVHIDMLSAEVVSTTSEHLKSIILGLGTYFFSVNSLLKRRAMSCRMRKSRGLKVIRYTAHVIEPNL